MHLSLIKESNPSKWDSFLKSLDSNIFLSSQWLESFKNKSRNPIYFKFESDGKIVGLAAGLSINAKYAFLNKIYRIIYLFTGPSTIDSDKELAKNCISKLISYANYNNYTHVIIKSFNYPYLLDLDNLPFKREERDEYVISLTEQWAEIKKRMRRLIFKNTRIATRNGLIFHESTSTKIIDDLIRLLEETKKVRLSKGYEDYNYFYIPYLTKTILQKIFLSKKARIFFVQRQTEKICILLILVHENRAYALLIGTNKEGYKFRAPAFIWYNTIKKLKEEEYQSLNLGGVPDDTSRLQLIFAKTSLGACKYRCSGGQSYHLGGRLLNIMTDLYLSLPDKKTKELIRKIFTGKEY